MTKVEIGRKVDPKDLEAAVIKAAAEMGWKATAEDEFTKEYRLVSVQEVQTYWGRNIRLKRILPQANVTIYGPEPTDKFYIDTLFAWASEQQVKRYLEAVSKHLPNQQ